MADEPEEVIGEVVGEDSPAPDTAAPWEGGAEVEQTGHALAVTPQVEAAELVKRLAVIEQAQRDAMKEGVDYGIVPGTQKPSLFKPGAEKLNVLFQLDIQLVNEKLWDGDHLTVMSHATVYHAPTGARLGYGEGLCTTKEKKYATRKEQRVCPECGEPAVIKGKAQYGGGWLCWRKRDGCGTTWDDDTDQAKAFESAEVGEIPNPDLPDTWNTIVKMAEKRARVDAVLAVTGASALFTQDVEDQAAAAGSDQDDTPPFGQPFGSDGFGRLQEALQFLMDGGDGSGGDQAEAAWAAIMKDAGDYMPDIVGRALLHAAAQLKAKLEANDNGGDDAAGKE
jgi:hypothetical protein